MAFVETLVHHLEPVARSARTHDVYIGVFWTMVILEMEGMLRAGIAATTSGHHETHDKMRDVGQLHHLDVPTLLSRALSDYPLETGVGIATANALLNPPAEHLTEVNARELVLRYGKGRRVAMVGHFPFVPQVRQVAATLDVLELHPQKGDLPADEAPRVIPQADVVAITGTTLLNGSFDTLVSLCRRDALVILMGGTAPLTSLFFEVGIDIVAGTQVVDIDAALRAITQGGGYRQIPGKRLVTLSRCEMR